MTSRKTPKHELKHLRPLLRGKPPPQGCFGEVLYNYRLANQLTQDELSERMGYKSRSMLCRWFTGRGQPKWSTIWKIAQKLGVPVAELFPPEKFRNISKSKAVLMMQINQMSPAAQKEAAQFNEFLLYQQAEKERMTRDG